MDQRPLRPRISLLAFLLVAAVICLGISHWQTSRELAQARSELRRLRDEVGYLTIEDKTKFHAVALDSEEPNTWRWRLFVPQGNRYKWNIAAKDIPQSVPPAKAGISVISQEPYWENDNEVLVTARLREAEDGDWTLSIQSTIGDSRHQMSGGSLAIPQDAMAWMTAGASTDGQVIGSRGTTVHDPNGPIILLQRRPLEERPDGTAVPSAGPMPGFMIWLSKW